MASIGTPQPTLPVSNGIAPAKSAASGAGTPATASHRSAAAASRPTVAVVAKFATYATALTGIYLSVGFLFYYAAHEKLFVNNGTMPAALQKLFAGSFFASVPGDNTAWLLLGLLEAAVVVLLAVSLIRGEFLPSRRKPILLAGLGVSLLAFGVMGLANDMVGNDATVIELFTYFGLTIVVMFFVRQMSPYRPLSWLGGGADE